MSVIAHVPDPNLWDVICKDFQTRRPPFRDDDEESVHTTLDNFDPSKHSPVFFGNMYDCVKTDENTLKDFDPSISHPACVGYTFVERPPESPPPPPEPLPDKDTCSPKEYLDSYIFPVLLPALEDMLREAKHEKCFERKRTKFNALDFLTEYLYGHNPNQESRDKMGLGDIPFVKEHWKEHPRPPLPKSLLWSEGEASLIIQAFWRGYKVRLDPEIQDLRQWQKEWRNENEDIKEVVDGFWAKQMPGGSDPTPNTSEEQLDKTEDKPPSQETTHSEVFLDEQVKE